MKALVASCAFFAVLGCANSPNTPVAISSKPMCMPCTNPCTPDSSCGPTTAVAAAPKPAPAPAPAATPAPAPIPEPPKVTASPTFSPTGGQVTGTQFVTIDAPKGATVRYTTDGSEPSLGSPIYFQPIPVSESTTVKAFASAVGQTDSAVASATYEVAAPPPVVAEPVKPPEPPRVVVTAKKLELKEMIFFETGKDAIKPVSYGILDEIAEALKSHPEIKQVRVEGHTDSLGNAAFNQDLSQRRAEAVRAYLLKKGTEAERLDAKGYGPQRPIAPNTTAKGRESNRRVEFNIPE
jgi:outer membrane protein OmpA-like peptidoglycan-associated protein